MQQPWHNRSEEQWPESPDGPFISARRERVYRSYEDLLATKRQPRVDFPVYGDSGHWVFGSDDIEDTEFAGRTYFAGRVVLRKVIGHEGLLGIVIRTTPDGILPFEEYSKRNMRPVFVIPEDKGVVVNLTSLEANKNNDLMQGKTPDEVMRINFACFPLLLDKSIELGEEEYREFYRHIYSENPIFF